MDIRTALEQGNRYYVETCDKKILTDTAEKGQRPVAIVVCCSDSRVIPEKIFSCV